MSDYQYVSDDHKARRAEALKAAMPYIIGDHRDAYAMAREGDVFDVWGAVRDALKALWRTGEAYVYPAPKVARDYAKPAGPAMDENREAA